MNTYDRILGCIYGAALGDAMGANTETKTTQMIIDEFGGYYFDLLPIKDNVFLKGSPAGYVTDDFSLAWYTARSILDAGGRIDDEVAKKALLDWDKDERYNGFAGPSTRSAIARLKGEEVYDPYPLLACDNSKATNGSGMKIFPVGLACPDDLDRTVEGVVTICTPTHNNQAALSAAAAVACAVNKATDGGDLDEVISAGFYGAKEGFRYGKKVSVASVEKRMALAVQISEKGLGFDDTMRELADVVGCGLAANEAIPSVFGVLKACGGDALECIKMAVNMGNDTDTVATMVGAIAGAMCGSEVFPKDMMRKIEEVNDMDLEGLAKRFAELRHD